MKPPIFDFVAPASLEEVVRLLAANADAAKLIAGGQSLVPVLNLRLANPSLLIDLNCVQELAGIALAGDRSLNVGAMTRHRVLELDPQVRQGWPLLPEAARHIAHVQIRNRGTIGGSLCHADPAAEWPAICVTCDAHMTIVGPSGSRIVPAEDFSLGVYSTALEEGEILTAIRFPAWPAGRRWAFEEVSRRHGDFALAGVCCLLDMDRSGACEAARIVVFAAGDRPTLIYGAADLLLGIRPDASAIAEAARVAREQVETRADHHASAEYRSELIEVLIRRALARAVSEGIRN